MRTALIAITALVATGTIGTIGLRGQAPASSPAQPRTDAGVSSPGQIAAESARLNEWFEARYAEQLAFSPIAQTFQGIKDRYDEIDDMSEAAQLEQLAWQLRTVADLRESFNYDLLSPQDRLSYDLWVYQVEQVRAGLPFLNHGYIFEQMNGPQSFLPTFLINFHAVESESDMEAYVSRIRGLARATDQLRERAARAAGQGVRPPRFAYEGAMDQAARVIDGAPFRDGDDTALWADARQKIAGLVDAGTIGASRAAELTAAARSAFIDDFQPSFESLIAWLEQDLAHATELAAGASALPNGEAYYGYMLSASTTTDLTADDIHQIGLREVARLRGEMEALKASIGFEGGLQEFFTFIRDSHDDRRFYFPDTDDGRLAYISEAEERLSFIDAKLPEFFRMLPKADLVVRRVEAFREQDGAAQHYYPGTPDGSRPGVYYAHLSDMTSMPRNELEVIAYHEGSPGHHMQISIAQELEGVPTFRTQAGFTGYTEGWALYAELLAKEMGAFQEPYSDFGRLGSEIWRAIRLVVDTGMHAKGWTEQDAIDYFLANSPAPKETVTSEVRRYLVWPSQATSYKIGMLKILELREYARTELGDAFDIRDFHSAVLDGGALPMVLLERKVKDWVAAERAARLGR